MGLLGQTSDAEQQLECSRRVEISGHHRKESVMLATSNSGSFEKAKKINQVKETFRYRPCGCFEASGWTCQAQWAS
jgi:hypothetical protein